MHRVVLTCGLLLAACGQRTETANQMVTVNQARADPAAARVASAAPIPVTMKAADGVVVHGDLYQAAHPKALIVLFHQAGSSKAEYAMIAPRLVEAGYSALAIDQRSGGSLYGTNETMAGLGKPPSDSDAPDPKEMLGALPDLQAALDLALTKGLPVILWGSSYSSSLVFPLAVANPGKVKAILSFSPGEYFADKTMIERAAAKVQVPVFVTSAPTTDEQKLAKPIFDAVPGPNKTDYVPKAGVHGSSTLLSAKDPAGADANWQATLGFLRHIAP